MDAQGDPALAVDNHQITGQFIEEVLEKFGIWESVFRIGEMRHIPEQETLMTRTAHYRINYVHNGTKKSFYVSAETMSDAEAWHWAAMDSGVAQIPKFRRDKVQVFNKPLAERHGIVEVQWSQA